MHYPGSLSISGGGQRAPAGGLNIHMSLNAGSRSPPLSNGEVGSAEDGAPEWSTETLEPPGKVPALGLAPSRVACSRISVNVSAIGLAQNLRRCSYRFQIPFGQFTRGATYWIRASPPAAWSGNRGPYVCLEKYDCPGNYFIIPTLK